MTIPIEYRHTIDMGQISGFSGSYENTCQDMLNAGVHWIMEKKMSGNDLKAHTLNGVYGIIMPENDAAKELEAVLVAAAKGDCTGAMMQAVMTRCIYIAHYGWEKYCAEIRATAARYS